ncbi:hypothetical protein Gferi_01105 [Geosporobacter ferrireducens]|uniref:Uncharacterized protein n=1 Tax=Geosporobacter ferrireducens TaxID=1424294 RepID=A0A1D8GBL4_9FIRM|nr:hypothetical protein Gferi_01105 [Geosporobacter ferrireducens]
MKIIPKASYSISFYKKWDILLLYVDMDRLQCEVYTGNSKSLLIPIDRVIVLNRDSIEPFQINIGDMTTFSYLTTADKLFNDGYCLKMNFDPEKDLVKID